jgi:UDP-N-acetylglucosamine 2-epimerase (non-hydrolysing)
MKVLTVVGTRPEIIRLSRVIFKLDQFTEHILVHTGQNFDYELNKIFFDDLGVRIPDYFLNAAESNLARTIGSIITKIDEVLEKENPDALLVLGDTNSGLSVIPAKRRKIPIFHMEAGNRCYDQRVPEETNRKIIDHISDINLTYSSIAREYLLKEGFPAEQVIKTGSPMFEVLNFYMEKIESSNILESLDLFSKGYFVVSSHREENVDSFDSLSKIIDILNRICDVYNMPVIFSVHPRTKIQLDKFDFKLNPLIKLLKPLGFLDYVKLQKDAFCVISDSGTITEESSILKFAAINLRAVHERPEGMEEGAVIMTGLNVNRVIEAIPVAIRLLSNCIVKDYDSPLVSEKVTKIILSYTDFVRQRVWKEY